MDERLREMLRELGDAINESVSESSRVHETMEKFRDHGYQLFLNLDARIGIVREASSSDDESEGRTATPAEFRIDFRDLRLLKSLGIDPTRKVRTRRGAASPRVGPTRRRASGRRD